MIAITNLPAPNARGESVELRMAMNDCFPKLFAKRTLDHQELLLFAEDPPERVADLTYAGIGFHTLQDGGHGVLEKSGTIALQAKEYPFMVKYAQLGSAKALKVSWEGPHFSKKELTAEVLFHRESIITAKL